MPQVLAAAAIGAGAGAIGLSTATLFGSAIIGGAVLYGGLALAATLLAPKPPSYSTYDSNLKTTIRSGVVAARWVIGRARSAGVLAYILEPDDTDHDLHLILLLAEGEVEGIERVWLNGDILEWQSGSASSSKDSVMPNFKAAEPPETSKFHGRISMTPYYNGIPDGAAISAVSGSGWTNAHKLTGKAAIHIKLNQASVDGDRVFTSIPNFEFLIKGLKIKWPGQAVPKWTDNAAALRYWWLTERRAVPDSAINKAAFKAAYDYCGANIDNELPAETYGIEYPASSRRYTINGVVQASDDHAQVEAEMDFAWAGNVIEAGGQHYFRPGRDDNVGRPIPKIDHTDIISRLSIQPAPALSDRLNAATMRLAQSSVTQFQEAGVPEFVDEDGVDRDGGRLPKDLGVRAFVCCPSAAGRLLAVMVRRARAFKRYEIVITPGDDLQRLELMPSDLVMYNDGDLGIDNVRCVVVAKQQNADYSLTLTLEQQLAGTHADSVVLPPLHGRGRIAARSKPLPPTGVKAVSEVEVAADNTAQSLIKVSWNASPHTAIVDITGPANLSNIFVNQDTIFATNTTIAVPFPGTYKVSVRFRDRRGAVSDAVSINVLVDWSDVPDAIDITGITQNPDGSVTITYDTGNSVTIGVGKGIKNITRNATTGQVVVTYTDDSTDTFTISDGAAGGVTEWIYRATSSNNRPATPATTAAQKGIIDFVPAGWLDDPPASGTYIWVSSRSRTLATDAYSDFSQPSPFRGAVGATGPRGAAGPAAPRVWSLLFTKAVDDTAGYRGESGSFPPNNNDGRTFTLRASMLNYDWIAVFGRGWVGSGHSAFAWSAMIDVAELRAMSTRNTAPYNTLEIQSVNSSLYTYLPFIRYKTTTTIDVGATMLNFRSDINGYLDEVWGVES